jgi:lipooligosaccharide transport system permease protein
MSGGRNPNHRAMSARAKSAPPRERSALAGRTAGSRRIDDGPEHSEWSVRRSATGALTVVEHELLDARRYWRSVVVAGLLTPLLYVLALGIGLGTVVNNHGNTLGVPYVQFVAPAFLTAAALQTAAASSTFPVMAGFKWIRYYHGMAATPLTPRQICDGKVLWVGLRTLASSALYFAIMACFGAVHRWQGILGVPAAALTGLAFAAPVLAMSATVSSEGQAFNVLFRFIVTPMFLFSGTFYPISQLPQWGRWLAHVSPLWHGTELARGAALGSVSDLAALGHTAYLLLWLVAGIGLARWRFRVRLTE